MAFRNIFDLLPGRLYTLFNALGIVAALLCTILLARWEKKKKPDTFKLWRYLVCFVVSYLILFAGLNLLGTLMMLGIGDGVVAFVGGAVLFIPAMLILARCNPTNGSPTRQLELALPGLALNQALNRTACFLGGCCHGVPSRFGIVFPNSAPASLAYGPGVRVFPSQLIEMIVLLLCFAFMLWFLFKGRRVYPIFPLVFGLTGFLLEFVAGSNRGNMVLGMNLQQWAYLLLLCEGLILLLHAWKGRARDVKS